MPGRKLRAVGPPNSEARLTLQVPVERKEHDPAEPGLNKRHNVRVSVEIAQGFKAPGCEQKAGWSCQVVARSAKVPYHVAFDRRDGPFEATDVFAFTVRTPAKTDEPAFEVNQTYSEGDVSQWDGPPHSDKPAARLRVQ